MTHDPRPRYDQLPVREKAPAGSAWGVFGDDDQVGMLNLLTPDRVREAATLVRHGRVFSLNLELHLPSPPLFEFRQALRHDIFAIPDTFEIAWDDSVALAPQGSSQWDGLTHVRDPEAGFYNGVQPADITGAEGTKNGIEQWARRGIAGRGVLVDVPRYMHATGRPYDPVGPSEITVDDLRAAMAAQRVSLRQGDILLLRTGWLQSYRAMDQGQRAAMARDARAAGLRPDDPFPRFFWDEGVAAVAADNIAVERWPVDPERGFLHVALIAHLGMALGELWDLDALADDCASDGVYECMVVSAPLHLRGGVGSPPNALALK